jgi:hypothetical protein
LARNSHLLERLVRDEPEMLPGNIDLTRTAAQLLAVRKDRRWKIWTELLHSITWAEARRTTWPFLTFLPEG